MTDKAVHARAKGKATTRASIVWELSVGILSVRCRRVSDTNFAAETRSSEGWVHLFFSDNAEALLRVFLETPSFRIQIVSAARSAKPKS